MKNGKAVKSTDPRKKQIMAKLKQFSGATKITNVKEGDQEFYGTCWKKQENSRKFDNLGVFTVNKDLITNTTDSVTTTNSTTDDFTVDLEFNLNS